MVLNDCGASAAKWTILKIIEFGVNYLSVMNNPYSLGQALYIGPKIWLRQHTQWNIEISLACA